MRLSVVCFTKRGAAISNKLSLSLNREKYCCELASTKELSGFTPITDLKAWTKYAFSHADGILFVGACGIAVRSIAPFLKSKTKDPAVVVIDDTGSFAIPILSGHIGGANDLAREIAGVFTGMTAVITTATDGQKLLAIDSFALKNNMTIMDMQAAKAVSAALLDDKIIGLKSQFSCFHLPPTLKTENSGTIGISISVLEKDLPFTKTLLLVPKILHLGIGCKKNTPMEAIENFFLAVLQEQGISIHSIKAVASIELKAEEAGILAVCKKYNWSFITYTAKKLNEIKGNFTPSDFVKMHTGVDNVCERAALLSASEGGELLQTKLSKNGVTLALAMEKWSVDFAK